MTQSRKLLQFSILLPALWAASTGAYAELQFTFKRVSDTEAVMTGAGSAGLGLPTGINVGNYSQLELRGVFDRVNFFVPADGFAEQTSGDFKFGRTNGGVIPGWNGLQGDMVGAPSNPLFWDGDSPSGTSFLKVGDVGNIQWRAAGTSGQVWATHFLSVNGSTSLVQVGTWQISPVPEPGSLALALCGLGLLGLHRACRSRQPEGLG